MQDIQGYLCNVKPKRQQSTNVSEYHLFFPSSFVNSFKYINFWLTAGREAIIDKSTLNKKIDQKT